MAVAAVVFVLAGAAPVARAEEAGAGDLLEQARAAYRKRGAVAHAKTAVELYEKAIQASGGYAANWEGARATFYLGEFPMATAARGDRIALYDKGIAWAKAAVAANPRGAEGHFWLGTLYGVWGQARGILKSLSVAGDLRREGEAALKIDPNVECAGSYRLLGRYYFKVPRIAGGDRAKALELLREGVKRCPGSDLGRLYLAEVLEADGQDDQAREQLEHVIQNKTADPAFRAEYRFVKRWAEKALEDL